MILKCKLHETDILKCSIKTGGAAAKTQSKTVTPSDTEQTVYPDAGYLLSSVKVEPMPAPPTQSKTVTSAINQQTVTPDEGYLLSSVTVDGMPTETAEVTPTEQAQTVQPSEGNLLSEVAVGAIPAQYHDTSNADITADDVTQGKIAFGANGQIIGTNTFVKPIKGYFFEDFDSDGYATTIHVVGFDELPALFMTNWFTINARAPVPRKIQKIIIENQEITAAYSSQFSFCSSLLYAVFQADTIAVGNNVLSGCGNLQSVVFTGNVTRIYADAFNNDTAIMLYDFSHCTVVPTLVSTRSVSHASGCVIRVPQALLSEWQNADVWKDLTDVVWQGV